MCVNSNLIDSDEERVDVVPWGARVQCFLVLTDLLLNELSHLLDLLKQAVMASRQMFH